MVETAPRPRGTAERVQSLDRTFELLERLADAGRPVSLSELAEASGLPMPTVHRLLKFLTGEGYVRQEPDKRYALGLRLIRLGQAASRGLGTWATPFLAGLVDRFGETANMAILQGDSVVYVAQVASPQSMRMFTEVGKVVMPHCTGVGKAILTELPDRDVVALLERTGMPARTEHTIVTPQEMVRVLGEARKAGYALDDGEQELGVRCIAVPVTGLPFLAALSVSGPSGRVTMDAVAGIAPVIQQVATEAAAAFRAHTGAVLTPR